MQRNTFIGFLGILLAVGACAPRIAEGSYRPYSIQVEDPHGHPLRSFRHNGQLFVLGTYGDRYVIRVTNHTARRVEAVVSVDGRDVLSGRPGDYERQRGYLVDPYGSVRIEGFRKDLGSVAAFRFTTPSDAYSSRMGTPENVGVIGAAFFPERLPPRRTYQKPLRSARPEDLYQERSPRDRAASGAGPAPELAPAEAEARAESPAASRKGGRVERQSRSRASADMDDSSNIGTQYGERRDSRVREVAFHRQNPRHPSLLLSVRYDDERGLVARGIHVHPRPVRHAHGPAAFPGNRFAPPPPGYY